MVGGCYYTILGILSVFMVAILKPSKKAGGTQDIEC